MGYLNLSEQWGENFKKQWHKVQFKPFQLIPFMGWGERVALALCSVRLLFEAVTAGNQC